jgi:hypothetical protein
MESFNIAWIVVSIWSLFTCFSCLTALACVLCIIYGCIAGCVQVYYKKYPIKEKLKISSKVTPTFDEENQYVQNDVNYSYTDDSE